MPRTKKQKKSAPNLREFVDVKERAGQAFAAPHFLFDWSSRKPRGPGPSHQVGPQLILCFECVYSSMSYMPSVTTCLSGLHVIPASTQNYGSRYFFGGLLQISFYLISNIWIPIPAIATECLPVTSFEERTSMVEGSGTCTNWVSCL